MKENINDSILLNFTEENDFPPLSPFFDSLPLPSIKSLCSEDVETWTNLKIRMMPGEHNFHSELCSVPVWTYDGTFPGPTIEVWREQKVRVEWANELSINGNDSSLPIKVVELPQADTNILSQNHSGSGVGTILPHTEDLKGWTVVHLHGGRTTPESDGWPENTSAPGQSRFYEYENDQRSTQLWYHDHAVHVTRLNVYSGLAGLWTIRDEEEENLKLPKDEYEIPLLIQDFNFETQDSKEDTTLKPQLLHKTVEMEAPEFFGPFTAVNGKVWPYVEVKCRWYRLRFLNGSNARTYRLSFYDQNGKLVKFDPSGIIQIGCDQGLLDHPVALPENGLILASSERADILIDFSNPMFADVTSLILVNTAPAPFSASNEIPPENDPKSIINLSNRLRWPWVMEFRLQESEGEDSFNLENLPSPLSEFKRIDHQQLPHHEHRLIALVEDNKKEVTLRELEKYESQSGVTPPPLIEIKNKNGEIVAYKTVAKNFDDATTIFVALGEFEVWKFINLTTDTHPIHIHQVEFQISARELYVYDKKDFDSQTGSTTTGSPISYSSEANIDCNEKGPKDVVRVNPGELLSITALFAPNTGRYIYHCHILEHEDHDMMRTFVILPKPVLDIHMAHKNGVHGDGHSHSH